MSLLLAAVVLQGHSGHAQNPPALKKRHEPADRLPPAGIAISATDRAELTAGAAALRAQIDGPSSPAERGLRGGDFSSDAARGAKSDVEIYWKAVDWALRYDEFFNQKEVRFARTLLRQGRERAEQLGAGQTPWRNGKGLIVRGYRSEIDGSVQPYGLFVPPTWHPGTGPSPLLIWLAGRNDQRTELAFLGERETAEPPFTPPDTLVLLPYGRFCNANKFAGERDVFEALRAVRKEFAVDPLRIAIGGFSMGGASVWHLATHHSGQWCFATPGAGFAETALYDEVLAPGKTPPPWWEQKLWHLYNATDYAADLFNCPTVAYSGEIDPQKQSADVMDAAMAAEGLKLERLIGPKVGHKYEPKTKEVLAARLNAAIAQGRPAVPEEVRLTTYTLAYPEVAWVRVEGLERHWERAEVRARRTAEVATVETKNVTALTLTLPGLRKVTIDGQTVAGGGSAAGPLTRLRRREGKWALGAPEKGLRKRPGLTGPVDDAFMSGFVFVRPTGMPLNPEVGAWVQGELAHATKLWRDIFRGDARVKDDTAVTAEDIRDCNLVLWGDPSSNRLIARVLDRLPLQWTGATIACHGADYDAANHAPILIYPNPLNPDHYVVLNSGMDLRKDAYGTNAEETPKLPDWAVVDLRTQPGPRWPGRIEDAGFFDERWQFIASGP